MPGENLQPITGGLNQQLQPNTIQATGTVEISLEERAAERVPAGTIEEREHALRERVTEHIIPAFKWINIAVAIAIVVLALLDEANIWFGHPAPDGRVITPQVVMALLGATAVQMGSIAVIISRYLFPQRGR